VDLRQLRFQKRISQWELSKQAGVHQSRISLIENGHPAKEEEKIKICKLLEINPEDVDWSN